MNHKNFMLTMVLSFKLRTDGEIDYTGNVPPATVQ
jgi:hypothetical protein